MVLGNQAPAAADATAPGTAGVPRGRCPLTRAPPPPAASRTPGPTASCWWPSLQHPLVGMTEGQCAGACHPGLLPHTHHLGLEPSAAMTVCSHLFKLHVLLTHEKTIKHLLFFSSFFLRRAGSRGAPWWSVPTASYDFLLLGFGFCASPISTCEVLQAAQGFCKEKKTFVFRTRSSSKRVNS